MPGLGHFHLSLQLGSRRQEPNNKRDKVSVADNMEWPHIKTILGLCTDKNLKIRKNLQKIARLRSFD